MSKELFDARRSISQVKSLLRQDNFPSAVQALHKGLQGVLSQTLLKSESREFENMLAEAVYALSSQKKSLERFPLALEYAPGKERELLGSLSLLLEAMTSEAALEAEKRFQEEESKKKGLLAEGEAALLAGDKPRAGEIFNSLAGDVGLLVDIAEAYERAAQLEEAAVYLEKALAGDLCSAYLHNKRGVLYRKLKNFPRAEEAFSSAIKLTPDDPYLYFNAGRLYMDWGKWPQTREYALKALELRGDFAEAQKMAAYAEKYLKERPGP